MGDGQKYVYLGRQKTKVHRRSQQPRGPRRGSTAARLLGLRFQSRREHGCLTFECCVLAGRGLRVGLMIRPEELHLVCLSVIAKPG